MSSTTFWETYLSPKEAQSYTQLFKLAGRNKSGIVTGTEAVQFFATSGVPNAILSEIWETADRDNVGYLTPETFSIALKLIACAQHGKEISDPILSTSTPLPQFEGISLDSPAISNAHAAPVMTPAERKKYIHIFQAHQPANGVLDADIARTVFVKSKLPTETLGQIWQLVDARRSGGLNQTEFAVAMHFIAKLMDGTLNHLPPTLSPDIYASACETCSSPQSRSPFLPAINSLDSFESTTTQLLQWEISAQEKVQYGAFFDKIDVERTGFVQGKEAVEFFRNSRLPEMDLAHAWDLADTTQRGRLSREEFIVAMYLIHKRLRGEPLPPSLPNSLAPRSPMFVSESAKVSSLLDDQDLLGDFSNKQVTQATNEMNLLQNQVGSFKEPSQGTATQKLTTEQTIEQLGKQKHELQAYMTQVKMAHETEVRDLVELQERLHREETLCNQAREEREAVQQQLSTIQNEVAHLDGIVKEGHDEKEFLRQNMRVIQEETARLIGELAQMRSQVKQQDMMLGINRRQVTASEQDRDLAQRNLRDFREERGLPKEEEKEEEKESTTVPSHTTTNLNFFHISPPQSNDEISDNQDNMPGQAIPNFDEIFSDLTCPTTVDVFDPVQNTRSMCSPLPPPQSKYQPVKHKIQQTPPATPEPENITITKSRNDLENEFGAAFSAQIANYTPTDNTTNPTIANFDDVFAFDAKEKNHGAEEGNKLKATTDINYMTMTTIINQKKGIEDEGTFELGGLEPSSSHGKVEDEWDSIFGGGSTTGEHVGFEDTFSSFIKETGEKEKTTVVVQEASKENKETTVGDQGKIEELMEMGFERQSSLEAPKVYDKDLGKMTNYLLDQTSK
ncbi:hypothetical protein DFQ28_008350 [Apophysomyces sp. BC1034]|nr:hypothetical protein DFQ30_008071 [Apophysomyces sp. BC1015]KAG0182759.1 hypothetical protein DFQ29_002394 [Apophysomyces sp. BC1021]KAG0186082.1 hypothetical protein DFQ28_008350 [Apophysomyces sp. BC1034]